MGYALGNVTEEVFPTPPAGFANVITIAIQTGVSVYTEIIIEDYRKNYNHIKHL